MYGAYAQHYKTQNGEIQFQGSVADFEEVRAKTNTASAILDTSTGSIASLIFINAFQFKIGLMQEHFNENYMESIAYPKATFRGSIENFNIDKLSQKSQLFVLIGDLTIRGITKKMEIDTEIYRDGGLIIVKGEFIVSPEEFDITIPKLVGDKIAEKINVSFNYSLSP